MRYFLLSIVLLPVLAGCSGGIMQIPSSEVIDSAGNVVTKTAATVGDTSSYRTHEKYAAWNVASAEYTKAIRASGFQMAFELVDVGGTKMYLPTKISFRERPDFHAPDDLKDHPVWRTIDNAVNKITPWGFGTWAAVSIAGSMEHMSNNAGNHYAGDVDMSGSYNNAGSDISNSNNGVKNSCTTGNCEGLDSDGNYMGIPGCSGAESYNAGRCSVQP